MNEQYSVTLPKALVEVIDRFVADNPRVKSRSEMLGMMIKLGARAVFDSERFDYSEAFTEEIYKKERPY